ncbi:MAG: hypothetical protein A2V67_05785 [Deltaproteobacteria bacterium RBG_13_61_14]|nr:MAG: hypothetical protein A2V67_05785 [Deltaproteobacteria bacterium RBG_13_61_14]
MPKPWRFALALLCLAATAPSDSIPRHNRLLRSAFRRVAVPELDRSDMHAFPWPGQAASSRAAAGIKGILRCSMDGLTAMRDYRLDRETLFQHLESRSVYATTGARILLDFSVNGKGMGEEISLPPNAPRAIRAEVHGQAPVSEVAVIREDPQKPVQVWRFDPPILDPGVLEWTDPEPLKSSTWYYLRVIQSDHHLAWSSPVWLDPDPLP